MKRTSMAIIAGLSMGAGASLAIATPYFQNPCSQCDYDLRICISSGETGYSCYDNYVECMIGNGCMVP